MLLALSWEFLKWTTFLLILLLFIGCPLIHGYSTNSLLSAIIASTWLLLTTWLNSWESICQPTNFAHLLILPFSVFPLWTHTGLVKGHFLMLNQLSGTLFFTKSGHPTPALPSAVLLIECVCVGGEAGRVRGERGEGEREREGERKGELVVYCKVWDSPPPPPHLFCFM